MFWKDAANVIQDLSQFQALYIEVHGCVWSECGVDNFDDDGENHDGDEMWYETRTHTFCANAAYSLYGIKKNNFKLVNTCSKGTYINSFFTYGGADTLAKALGLDISAKDGNLYGGPGDDDGSYYTANSDCVAVENNGRERFLSGSSEDEDDGYDADYEEEEQQVQAVATTMGCAASATSKYNKFVLAGFSDESCSGRNFLQTLDSYKSYNRAMRKVSCYRIWNARQGGGDDDNAAAAGDDMYNVDDDNNENRALLEQEQQEQDQDHRQLNDNENNQQSYKRIYNSVAERLLYQSWACDLSLYPNQCPDPYGLKRKYFNVMRSAKNGQPIHFAVWNARVRKPIQVMTWLLMLVGAYLCAFAYSIRNRAYIKSNGGGIRGHAACVARDAGAATVALRDEVKKAKDRHMSSKKSRRSGSNSSRKDKGGGGLWATMFGKKKKKKKKRKSKDKDKSIRRTPSGRSLEPPAEQFNDEEDGSAYTEMTDDYSPSQRSQRSRERSRGSSRNKQYNSANYSSNRTSKAAEAAFAAAAQFDLEQQQQAAVSPNRHHHPSILPSNCNGASGSGRRSRSAGKGRRGRSRSPSVRSETSSGRARSLPRSQRGQADPSPQRSPGGSKIRRSSSGQRRSSNTRSRSPQHHRFV